MSEMATDKFGDSLDTSYEPFSKEPEYIELNRQFVHSLGSEIETDILDLACGMGTLAHLILEEKDCRPVLNVADRRNYRITCLDVSFEALKLASDNANDFQQDSARDQTRFSFVQASADCLPISDDAMQTVIMGNAIQLIANKERLIREIRRTLRVGGIFAFNTSFYAGTYAPGTERFYVQWVEEAVKYLKVMDDELRSLGQIGVQRKRSQRRAAFSIPWLSPEDYEHLLDQNGFKVYRITKRLVMLTRQSFEAIGSYAGLASVLLSGYPLVLACDALRRSVSPALAASGFEKVPRYWIEFSARKRS